MLIDFDRDRLPEGTQFGAIIVGAGAVGLTMGVDLARNGVKVLVLEAGGASTTTQSQAFFETARSTGHQLDGLHTGRFRVLGGTTNYWGGQLVPFDPLIFQERPWVSDAKWPIAFGDVQPFYERALALLEMNRQIARDADIWRRLGIAAPPDTSELDVIFTRWVPETNFARLFDADIRNNRNLVVAINAPVTALNCGADAGTLTGVTVQTRAGGRIAPTAQRVILANGTFEIARLLKLALGDGRLAPWAGNAWIGRGFMDHLDCFVGHVKPIDKKRFHDIFDNAYIDGIKYNPKIKLSAKVQAERRLHDSAAHFVFNSSMSEHIANAKIFVRSLFRGRFDRRILSYPGQALNMILFAIPMVVRYVRYRRMYNFADRGIQLRFCTEQKPVAQSGVVLRNETDALGTPLMDVDWRIDGSELETIATFAELVRDYLRENNLAEVEIDPRLAARDPAFIAAIEDGTHQMGMARMSATAEDGVVDGNLKVHGTANLYVAGAAVYPTTGFANPTFTAIALGLRLANAIREGRA